MKKVFLLAAVIFSANIVRSQWEPDVRLTYNQATSWTSYNGARNIAVNGDSVHVVWMDNRNGINNYEIYYKRSTDGGLNWGADTRLTNAPDWSDVPSLSVYNSVVHVVWSDYRDGNDEIYYKHSTDGGSTWGADKRLTNALGYSGDPSVAVSGSVVHVVWMDERNNPTEYYPDIYYKRSTDGGLTWGPDTMLTNKTQPSWSGYPCIVVSGSVVHVVWEDDRDGNGNIYYKRSIDGGLNWGTDTRLTDDLTDSWDPCISLSDSILHVVWENNRDGTYDIYYKSSIDSGLSWKADTRLTDDPGDSKYPSIAVSGLNVHIVWEDNRDGNDEIYYKQSVDAGHSWGADTRLTNASNTSDFAHIALSDSVVHVVWQDKRDGNDEIYYKRNPTGNLPVGIGNDLIASSGQQISIWPNPASNILHISFNNDSNSPARQAGEKTILTIRNILCEELLSKQIRGGETDIDVSNLQNGLYFVGIATSGKQAESRKLIILK